jgi:ethanolamine permease
MEQPKELKRVLTPLMVWGLGVGYVISGNYFGWNLGLERAGTLGLAIAIFFIIILYITFTFSYTELACAVPKAGGAFDYARRALGNDMAFIAGMAQNIEFTFAPPAIAFAIGAYFNIYFPSIPLIVIAMAAYVIFVSLNIFGVQLAAAFELGVTSLAVAAVVVFAFIAYTQFDFNHLRQNAFPFGWSGVFAAVPFAIWFFLGIEGVANLAEEVVNPKRTIFLGFGSAILTLVFLCLITFTSSVGVAGWEAIVFNQNGTTSDSPLPMALTRVVGTDHWSYNLLITFGLFGLVASFHGLMLAGGRSTCEFGRMNYAPAFLGKIHSRFQTPANALIVNSFLGLLALLTGKTSEIITLSVFGALTLYAVSMVAVLKLRVKEPALHRPFRVPLFPVFPLVALILATASFIALAFYNPVLLIIYMLILVGSFVIFKLRS